MSEENKMKFSYAKIEGGYYWAEEGFWPCRTDRHDECEVERSYIVGLNLVEDGRICGCECHRK